MEEAIHISPQPVERNGTAISGHGVVHGIPRPLDLIIPQIIDAEERQFELWIVGQQASGEASLVNYDVVQNLHDTPGTAIVTTYNIDQLQEQARVLLLVFDTDRASSVRVQDTSLILLLVLSQPGIAGFSTAARPAESDSSIEVHVRPIHEKGFGVTIGGVDYLLNRSQILELSKDHACIASSAHGTSGTNCGSVQTSSRWIGLKFATFATACTSLVLQSPCLGLSVSVSKSPCLPLTDRH